ncbi:serine hydrolase domain-containing protein [Fictibacillus fluitans]|uniref:Serine hydrolase domain-containing protein n=1 Tax=Fictibacillus fluitans TaxID=3058422 RepID=A0ABT8I2G9_9BACL|nr:serine hydrolase domain-containing protein [Fictibacillus sp. NE201]MDN4526682.1 serine hydrolase domain-containing protein [Fictibacillus sp. NE201]
MAVNEQKLISYVEEIMERNHSSAAALVVIKDNKIILEHYHGYHSNAIRSKPITEVSKFNVASARKSYLGLAVAFALYEKKIKSLDDYAVDYFDEYDEKFVTNTTIRHLVTHSHGLHQKDDGTLFREFDAGTGWAYRGINVLMMMKLINSLYGKSFPELLKERVFLSLGLSDTAWYTKPNDELVKVIDKPNEAASFKIESTNDGSGSNLHTTAREFALWGNLHLNEGFLNGKQIVQKEVIRLATKVQSPNYRDKETPLNGLFWYVQDTPSPKSEIGEKVPKGSYQILGITGPTLLVIPKHNLVVAKMYNKRYNYGGDNYLHYLREFSNIVADTFS